ISIWEFYPPSIYLRLDGDPASRSLGRFQLHPARPLRPRRNMGETGGRTTLVGWCWCVCDFGLLRRLASLLVHHGPLGQHLAISNDSIRRLAALFLFADHSGVLRRDMRLCCEATSKRMR